MELLTSPKFTLPKVFFITDRSEIKDIPIGIPFIFGDVKSKPYLVRILEYEVLYQMAIHSKLPFNFKQILKDNGYLDIIDFNYTFGTAPTISFSSEGYDELSPESDLLDLKSASLQLKDYVKDSSCYVDVDILKNLKVFPVWLDEVEKAISTNINNFATFNHYAYNKKLDGMYGNISLEPPHRNLIIIDISGSIPKAVSSTCLALSKNLSESFYADILITGGNSKLFTYEEIYKLDIDTIYDLGTNNDQADFKRLLSTEERKYKTAVVFGDNDHPGHTWGFHDKKISDIDGQKLCKWEVDQLISLHTKNYNNEPGFTTIAGYGRWFKPKEIKHIGNWVKYLK